MWVGPTHERESACVCVCVCVRERERGDPHTGSAVGLLPDAARLSRCIQAARSGCSWGCPRSDQAFASPEGSLSPKCAIEHTRTHTCTDTQCWTCSLLLLCFHCGRREGKRERDWRTWLREVLSPQRYVCRVFILALFFSALIVFVSVCA